MMRKQIIHHRAEVVMAAPTNGALFSTMVRAGKITYFVDVKEAKNGSKFIAISETSFGENEAKQRTTVRVFAESIEPFRQAVDEAARSAGVPAGA
jgi:hypothetical protein